MFPLQPAESPCQISSAIGNRLFFRHAALPPHIRISPPESSISACSVNTPHPTPPLHRSPRQHTAPCHLAHRARFEARRWDPRVDDDRAPRLTEVKIDLLYLLLSAFFGGRVTKNTLPIRMSSYECSAPFASRARYCLYKRLRPLEKDVWPFSRLSKIFLEPQKRIWTSRLHKIFPQCLAFGVVNGVSKGRGETTT